MISWVRPQLLIPAHGEALTCSEHAKLARAAGVPKVLIFRDGNMVRLAPGEASVMRMPWQALQGRLDIGRFQIARRH